MIFNSRILFLHYPKTAGMMLSGELLKKLKGRVYYTLPKGHISPKERVICLFRSINILEGLRHENLAQATAIFTMNKLDHQIDRFDKIIIVIRNPYDFMVSRFHYLKDIQKHNRDGADAILAAKGDFRKFVLNASKGYDISQFLQNENGRIPTNMSIIKYENMATSLNHLLLPYLKSPINFNKSINKSIRNRYHSYIEDEEIEKAIYTRFAFLFDHKYYNRILM